MPPFIGQALPQLPNQQTNLFSGAVGAFDSARRNAQLTQLAREELDIKRENQGFKRQDRARLAAQREVDKQARIAVVVDQETDPTRRGQLWEQVIAGRDDLTPAERDPILGPKLLLAQSSEAFDLVGTPFEQKKFALEQAKFGLEAEKVSDQRQRNAALVGGGTQLASTAAQDQAAAAGQPVRFEGSAIRGQPQRLPGVIDRVSPTKREQFKGLVAANPENPTAALKFAQDDFDSRNDAIQSLDSAHAGLDRMAAAAQRILDEFDVDPATGKPRQGSPLVPGGSPLEEATGAAQGRLPSIRQSSADFDAALTNLKSQVGFAVLQAMRDASKTGGALGQVSERENVLLQENIAALVETQSAERMRESLKRIIAFAEGSKARLQRGFQQTYGLKFQPTADLGTQPASAPQPQSQPQTQEAGVIDFADLQ